MIALGSDHGGLALKRHVMEYLDARGLEYQDFGCYTAESCDYPDFGRRPRRQWPPARATGVSLSAPRASASPSPPTR